jgi:uncharacterized protein (DUF924 family)
MTRRKLGQQFGVPCGMHWRPQDVVEFWFGTERIVPRELAQRWFVKDPAFDAEIAQRFEPLIEEAASGALDGWLAEPQSALALVVVLDQFPRNIFRGQPRAFAHDDKALASTRVLIARGHDRLLTPHQRSVAYLPFQHCENREAQAEGLALYERLLADVTEAGEPPELIGAITSALDFARKHAELITRFGRFPHRNAILGRTSTGDELEYLMTPGAGF